MHTLRGPNSLPALPWMLADPRKASYLLFERGVACGGARSPRPPSSPCTRHASASRRSSRCRPFHFFQLGLQAMQRHDFIVARELFTRGVARAGHHHEFHCWLGVADWQLGDVAAAKRQLALLLDNSTTRRQTDLYAVKLAWLQAQRRP